MNSIDQTKLTKWVAGFFDGEGCVKADVSQRDTCQTGYGFQPEVRVVHSYVGGLFDAEGNVYMGVDKSDERNIEHSVSTVGRLGHSENQQLEDFLKKFSESAGIQSNVYHQKKCARNTDDSFHWVVQQRGELKKFLREIRPYSIVKRGEIDIMLEEIIPRIEKNYHTNRRGFLELVAWKDVMDKNKGGARGKYDLDYFENLWGMSIEDGKLPCDHPRTTQSRSN